MTHLLMSGLIVATGMFPVVVVPNIILLGITIGALIGGWITAAIGYWKGGLIYALIGGTIGALAGGVIGWQVAANWDSIKWIFSVG